MKKNVLTIVAIVCMAFSAPTSKTTSKMKMNMKKRLFLLLGLVCIGLPIIAQDVNDELGRYTDLQFNHDKMAVFVNDTFIKSMIGINIEKNENITDISIQKECEEPLVINRVTYKGKVVFTCTNEPEFVTLEDIRKQYCPEVTGPVIYMINKFFITNDVESYKIDKDFIQKCEVLPSSEFELFKNQPPFTFIRIFTKTKANTYPMRLR